MCTRLRGPRAMPGAAAPPHTSPSPRSPRATSEREAESHVLSRPAARHPPGQPAPASIERVKARDPPGQGSERSTRGRSLRLKGAAPPPSWRSRECAPPGVPPHPDRRPSRLLGKSKSRGGGGRAAAARRVSSGAARAPSGLMCDGRRRKKLSRAGASFRAFNSRLDRHSRPLGVCSAAQRPCWPPPEGRGAFKPKGPESRGDALPPPPGSHPPQRGPTPAGT